MKRCPKCQRTYKDDTLRFCLDDGTSLTSTSEPRSPSDDYATLPVTPTARESEPPPTEVMYPRGTPTLKVAGQTQPSYGRLERSRDDRQSNPLLTGGVIAIALLLLALVGIAGYFVLRQSPGEQSAQVNKGQNTSSPTSWTQPSPGQDRGSAANPWPSPETSNSTSSVPLKITATASSQRLAVESNTYYPANAIDGKRSTAWIEGVDGPGIGEWIRFDFDREINLHRILILPGYFKSPQIWKENNRLAAVTVYFSDGSSRELTFADRMDSQKFDVGSIRTRWVRIVIKEVYYGTDPDTAISEVAFEWEP